MVSTILIMKKMSFHESNAATLVSMCATLILVVSSVSALNLALPELAVQIKANDSQLGWIINSYTVTLAAFVLPFGALGDKVGRKKLLLVGTFIFGLAAGGGAAANTSLQLIVFRSIMGIGAAMMLPGTLATITASFSEEKQATGVAVWSAFGAVGTFIGLLGAGALMEKWGWESIFMASCAASIITGFLAAIMSPETKSEKQKKLDLTGSTLLALGFGSIIFFVFEGTETSFFDTIPLLALGISITSFVIWRITSEKIENPIVKPELFKNFDFRTGSLTISVQFLVVYGFFFVGIQYLQLILGYGTFKSAVGIFPVAIAVLPTSQLTPKLIEKHGNVKPMTGGLLLLLLGIIWLSQTTPESTYLFFLTGLLLAGAGFGLSSPAGTGALNKSLPRSEQGLASALNDATREVGTALGVAVMGSVYALKYKSVEIPEALKNYETTIESSAARGLQVATENQNEELTLNIRTAFVEGMNYSLFAVGLLLAFTIAYLMYIDKTSRKQNLKQITKVQK